MSKYIKRINDKILKDKLETFGAVWVVGPKWSGKTKTSEQFCKSIIRINEFDEGTINYSINLNPRKYIVGDKPILIDEWQLAPHIWDIVRIDCDKLSYPGGFILTGSTSILPNVSHTGTGRISELKMYPMSLYESGESNGKISLIDLFNGKYSNCHTELSFNDIIFLCCRGGWPYSLLISDKNKQLSIAKNYYNDIYKRDIHNINDFHAKSTIAKKVLKSYARNISTLAKNNTIYDDANIDKTTFNNYLDLFTKLYVIEEIEPWMTHLRSKSSIRLGNKREFIDPSIAVAALNATPEKLSKDLKTLGLIFETLCIRDIKVYSNALGGTLAYYRDKTGLECDCILELNDGRYCLIEIKLGINQIKEGIDNLNKIEKLIINYSKLSKDKIRLPSFKMVLTGTNDSSIQEGGVYVVPIGCLKD